MAVYVLQDVQRKDKETGEFVPILDFRKATVYGDLEFCLPAGRVSLSTVPTVETLNEKLRNFNDDDYIVPVGDPSAIAIAGAIAANNNRGKFKLLKWDKELKNYIKVQVNIFPHKQE